MADNGPNLASAAEHELGTPEHLRGIAVALGEQPFTTVDEFCGALRRLQVTESIVAAIDRHAFQRPGNYDPSIDSKHFTQMPDRPDAVPVPTFIAYVDPNSADNDPAPCIRMFGQRTTPSGLGNYSYMVRLFIKPRYFVI